MHNQTSVINIALARVGAQGVTSGFQDSGVAATAATAYQRSLYLLLTLCPWSFAARQQSLARSADAALGAYAYGYALPADCLRIIDATRDGRRPIHYDLAENVLYANADAVILRYVSADAAAASLPDLFADALAWRVAFEIAPYVEQGGSAKDLLQAFEQALDRAVTCNDLQRRPWPEQDSDVIRERFC